MARVGGALRDREEGFRFAPGDKAEALRPSGVEDLAERFHVGGRHSRPGDAARVHEPGSPSTMASFRRPSAKVVQAVGTLRAWAMMASKRLEFRAPANAPVRLDALKKPLGVGAETYPCGCTWSTR